MVIETNCLAFGLYVRHTHVVSDITGPSTACLVVAAVVVVVVVSYNFATTGSTECGRPSYLHDHLSSSLGLLCGRLAE